MASRSLGTLTLDLIAKIGGFTGPLDKASRESKKRAEEMRKSGEAIGKGFAIGVGAAVTAITALTVSTVRAGADISRLASLSGASTTEFQKFAAGAKAVGVEQDKLSDIFKDTNDKVGDFLSTGGGELQNFFTNIAPKVGVTADQFRNLSGPQALQLFATSLEKANVSQSEMTFYMEAIANDATLLVPLLRNGGEGFKILGEQAAAAGAIMDEKTIKSTQELSAAVMLAEQGLAGMKNELMVELLPVLSDFSKSLSDASVNGAAAAGIADIISGAMKFVASTVVGAVASFDLLGRSIGGTAATAAAAFKGGDWTDIAMGPVGLAKLLAKNWENVKTTAGVVGEDVSSTVEKYAKIIDGINNAGGGGQTNSKVKELAELLAKLREQGNKPGTFRALTKAQQDAAKAAEATAKKLQGSFDTAETGYQREIELINTSNDARKNATEVAKLQFEIESGKLVGINATQQKRLEGLAAELDALKKLKQANEDAAKLASFQGNLKDSNQTIKQGFEIELAGAGSGDKLKERLKTDLAIQQDYNQQAAELQKQLNGGDISKDLYDKETEMLGEALAERMVLQQDYYNQVDEAQSNWLDGVSSAWENYRDTAIDYQQQAYDFTASTLSDLTSSIGENLSAMVIEGQSLGDTFKNVASDMATSVINALTQMAAQWLVYQAVQLVTGQSSQAASVAGAAIAGPAIAAAYAPAAAMVSLASFGSNSIPATAGIISTTGVAESMALLGMAHDGIDAVPETGTWLLQKGERVTTKETSMKLDQTLDRVAKDSGGGSGKTEVNVIEDASRAGQSQQRTGPDRKQITDMWVSNIRGQGQMAKTLEQTYGLKRVGR